MYKIPAPYATRPEFRPATHIGSARLSVQASEFHYCTPRQTGLDTEAYTAFEVMVTCVPESIILPAAIISFFGNKESGEECIAAWMPRDAVYELAAILEEGQK